MFHSFEEEAKIDEAFHALHAMPQKIREAVIAERQRCAKIADGWLEMCQEPEGVVTARGIAEEIRNEPTGAS